MKMPSVEFEIDTKAIDALLARAQVAGAAMAKLADEAEKVVIECSERLAEVQRRFAVDMTTAMEKAAVDWPGGLIDVASHPPVPAGRTPFCILYTDGVVEPVLVHGVADTRRDDILLTDDHREVVSAYFAHSPGNQRMWLVPIQPTPDGDAP